MSGIQFETRPRRASSDFRVFGLAASAGGMDAISRILSQLPANFAAAIIVIRHRTEVLPNLFATILQRSTALKVKVAEDGDRLRTGTVYTAPPGLHLLVEANDTIHLVDGPRVHFVRPSADCLFQSMAASLKTRAVAVVLTGCDCDGSGGLEIIQRNGGVVVIQSPATSEQPSMPLAALATGQVDYSLPLKEIAAAFIGLADSPVVKRDGG